MLFVKDNPVGIDVPIRKFQERLHKELAKKWGIDTSIELQDNQYECYSRCYRNKKDNGYVAEIYTGKNEYKDVYWNDALKAISFFGIDTQIRHDIQEKTTAHLVFFVNLEKLKPAIAGRADEEVRLDVLSTVNTFGFGFKFLSVDLGIENVLREYPGSYRDARLKAVDMHPVHCFRINFSLIYNKNNCF